MEAVWATESTALGDPAARDIRPALPTLAYTTVITLLDRLVDKGLLERVGEDRPHRYRPTGSQASYIAGQMHEALATTPSPSSALACFISAATADQVAALREGLSLAAGTPTEIETGEGILV